MSSQGNGLPALADVFVQTQAHLLTGLEALAAYDTHGTPASVQMPPDAAGALLRRVCDLVGPADLSGGFASLYSGCRGLWRKGEGATLEDGLSNGADRPEVRTALRLCRTYGMGVAFYSEIAARRILLYRRHLEDHRHYTARAAEALEHAHRALHG